MSTHTPGPWRVVVKESGPGTSWREIHGNQYVEQLTMRAVQVVEPTGSIVRLDNLANARLIAAAPELLEALQDCVAVLIGMGEYSAARQPRDRARSLISRLTDPQ